MTDALVQFIRARLDEDDAVARAADTELSAVFTRITTFDPEMAADERHIMRHRPTRALYELAAKRLMLDEALASRHHISADQYETCPRTTEADGLDAAQLAALASLNEEYRDESGREPTCWDSCGRDARVHRILELLAMPYVDHADYMQAVLADRA